MKIVRLKSIEKEFSSDNQLFAVLGKDNPTGSIKDVAVSRMLRAYKDEGKIKEDTTIIEATSGNTGISLSYFHKEFGYRCLIVMPESMSQQRRDMISKYGAELVLIKGGMAECEEYAEELSRKTPNSFVFSQFGSKYNPLGHYEVTGPLIEKEVPDVSYLFAGIGTGGTISGTGRYLKEKGDCKVVGVEPFESPLLTKGKAGPHLIQGIGANFVPATLEKDYIDEVIDVKGQESIGMAKTIRNVENLDIGISSGAALLGALTYLKNNEIKGKKVVVVFPDKGDRYSW
ncbi:MAG: cysteine synthase family protein [Bacilli bacterium]|nr:cysteine synthase family protein [Bacilli bacterium]